MRSNWLKRITPTELFTFICVFNPMMNVYSSPIAGMDLGTFAVLLFGIVMMRDSIKKIYRLPRMLSLVLVYTIICTCIGITGFLYSDTSSIIFRLLRFVIVIIIMIGIGFPTYFSKELFMKYVGSATILVAGYAIFQTVVYYSVGIKVKGIFGPTKLTLDPDTVGLIDKVFYRPPSLFWEPSHASYFMTPYLCYLLFYKGDLNSKKDRFLAIFTSLGILVTTSGQGMFVLALCWGLWLLGKLKEMKLGVIIVAIFLIFVTLSIIDVTQTVIRVVDTENYNAVSARAGGYDLIKTIPVSKLIMGFGFGNYDETLYYSSFAEIIFCTGYIGLLLVIMMYLDAYFSGVKFQKVFVILIFVLMAGGGIYNAATLCLYLPILFSKGWKSNQKLRSISVSIK